MISLPGTCSVIAQKQKRMIIRMGRNAYVQLLAESEDETRWRCAKPKTRMLSFLVDANRFFLTAKTRIR